jgi:hypothetical protein
VGKRGESALEWPGPGPRDLPHSPAMSTRPRSPTPQFFASSEYRKFRADLALGNRADRYTSHDSHLTRELEPNDQ